MEIFTKNNLILKIVIALVFVILFNFCAPTVSSAEGLLDDVGGTLLEPIIQLFVAIGDGVMNLIQGVLFGMDSSTLKVTNTITSVGGFLAQLFTAAVGVVIFVMTGGIAATIAAVVATAYISSIAVNALPKTWYLPIYAISPEEMFQNKIALLDVNFFNPNEYEPIQTLDNQGTSERSTVSTASQLQGVISNWYLALRNFALVALLSVLLYIGIKIVISSTAQDKAKYKEKLYSWIIAVCLLFFMHYIMAFATTIVEAISEGITGVNKPIVVEFEDLSGYYVVANQKNEDGEYEEARQEAKEFFESAGVYEGGKYYWPTNLMGKIRLDMQLEPEGLSNDNSLLRAIGYTALYLIMVFYTVGFLVMYIKRVIMLAFLTMMAPLVAMTYPIDKMSDGNAQAFNMWLKEYVFNLLIQPLHLILYTMLIGSAIEFASENIIYSIVALGFLLQAEKIMRKFFGFEKASTVESGSTAALGGALAMAGINQIKRIAGGPGRKSSSSDKAKEKDKNRIRTADDGRGLNNLLTDAAGNPSENPTDGSSPSPLPSGGSNTNSDGVDYERASRFRALRESGMSQEDAENILNSQIPLDRTQEEVPPPDLISDPEYQYDNRRSAEWNRLEREKQAIFSDDSLSGLEKANKWQKIRESDTRGITQAIADSYHGSRLGNRLNTVGEAISNHGPAKWVRSAGNSVRDMVVERVPKPIRNSIRGATSVVANRVKDTAPQLGKVAVRGVAAGVGAFAGGVAGIASDNDANIGKYAAIGAGVGLATSSGIEGRFSEISEGYRNTREEYNAASHGLEGQEALDNSRADKEFMKDKEAKKLYRDKLGLKSAQEVKKAMEAAKEYRRNGITDDKIIIKAMKLDNSAYGEGYATRDKMIVAGLASETGNDNKKIKQVQDRLVERGISNEASKKYIDGVRKVTKAI